MQSREQLSSRPIEASVSLLPFYEFFQLNSTFRGLVLDGLSSDGTPAEVRRPDKPLLITVISFSSYLFSHASSTSTPRSLAYANLALRVFLLIAEEETFVVKLSTETGVVRICQQVRIKQMLVYLANQGVQRLPRLPENSSSSPILSSFLDCCVLWLRHNLHKKLQVSMYRCVFNPSIERPH